MLVHADVDATNALAFGLIHGSDSLAHSSHTAVASSLFRQGKGASHTGRGGSASGGAAAPRYSPPGEQLGSVRHLSKIRKRAISKVRPNSKGNQQKQAAAHHASPLAACAGVRNPSCLACLAS